MFDSTCAFFSNANNFSSTVVSRGVDAARRVEMGEKVEMPSSTSSVLGLAGYVTGSLAAAAGVGYVGGKLITGVYELCAGN